MRNAYVFIYNIYHVYIYYIIIIIGNIIKNNITLISNVLTLSKIQI